MSFPLNRRELLGLGLGVPIAGVAGRLRQSGQTVRTRQPTAPDVVATYRAAPANIDLGGVIATTWAYDGIVPGRFLRARAGDLVEVIVDNRLEEATSIHWHGIAIANDMDGVPGLTQDDIETAALFTYRFTVPDPGTYWFHPHHGLQLDRGLYAPLIVDGDDEAPVDVEYVLVLDDWLDSVGTTPEAEFVRIREMGQSMSGPGGHDMSEMASSPVLGGDAGDAVYPHHLINGHALEDPITLDPLPTPGDRVRLRFINAGGDTAYRVAVSGHRMTVTHSDGFPVDPVEVGAIVIGMGERYDVTIDVQSGVWPVVALAEGKNARAAAVLRTRDAAASAAPDVHSVVPELAGVLLRYSDLRAARSVALQPTGEVRRVEVKLTGDMMSFDWGFGGRRLGDHEPIVVDEGEWVNLRIENTTTMWHPVHLHGHTAQLESARRGPRKDTVNVLPGEAAELLLLADNPGQWMLHCHNAYHLEAGMATVLSYRDA